MRALGFVVASAVLFANAAHAAPVADAPLGLAAGYKALFTCSATFLANRSSEQIARNELAGIYADYVAPMAKLPAAQIDRRHGWVSVGYDQLMPPRVAFYRKTLGCVLLPPGGGTSLRVMGIDLPEMIDNERDLAWPNGDKTDKAPSGIGARDKLGALLKKAFDGKTYGRDTRTSGVVVASRDRLLAESYTPDSGIHVPQRTWSVAKSLMGAIIGIAVKERLLRVEERVAFPSWSGPGDPRGQITFLNLMNMASGLDAGVAGNRTDEIYFGGGLVEEHALTRELAGPPGMRWNYANNDALLLSYALRERIRDDRVYFAYPYEKLFRRIGMRHTTAETDWGGTFILSSQVWTTARDLARFGLLLLNDGKWNGQGVLPPGWVRLMGTPAAVQPPPKRADGTPSPGYGAQIWLYDQRHGLPDGTLSAQGNRGQYIVVVPARGIVIVRRGFDGDGVRFGIDAFAVDVLKAME
jgi:CubicO group peptidase (beta-lactamase class C family)